MLTLVSFREIKLMGERLKTVKSLERLFQTMITVEEMRLLREHFSYVRRKTNKLVVQQVTDKMLRGSEVGRSWLEVEEEED